MHSGGLGSVPALLEMFGFFRFFGTILVMFGRFGGWGAYFYGRFTFRGLTFIGANYWEVTLVSFLLQIFNFIFKFQISIGKGWGWKARRSERLGGTSALAN